MKRTPSKPLLGTPVVVGTSVAVMAMRSVPCAIEGPAMATAPSQATLVSTDMRSPVQLRPVMEQPPLSADCVDRKRVATAPGQASV